MITDFCRLHDLYSILGNGSDHIDDLHFLRTNLSDARLPDEVGTFCLSGDYEHRCRINPSRCNSRNCIGSSGTGRSKAYADSVSVLCISLSRYRCCLFVQSADILYSRSSNRIVQMHGAPAGKHKCILHSFLL